MVHVRDHRLLVYLTWLQAGLGLLGIFLMWFATHRPVSTLRALPDQYLYYGEMKDGAYHALRPQHQPPSQITHLPEPMKSVDQIADLAASVVASSLTMNFVGYYEQLSHIRSKFTDAGWKSFGQSLLTSGFIDAVLTKKLSVSAVVLGTPVLLNQGMLGGHYAWRFQMPVLVTYESASDKKSQNQMVTIIFKRVSLEGKGAEVGIAVDSFVTSV